MSVQPSLREPAVLDPTRHKKLRLIRSTDYSPSADLHASFLAAAEFASAALDFVIMFVRDQIDGRVQRASAH